ncbi:hypothetical protein [Frankia sp. AgPm24]|uniref:hypothetical protein n=1 Tax=Frankia sp. AgPm24 TaxID=631128 RepID=UPI00200F4CB3|nr:hypothetical protein [Frankia sp. AgPm24]
MEESIATRLGRAASQGPRAMDRVCEQVAGEFLEANIEPRLRIPSADFAADPWLVCADRYWRRRLLAEPTVEVAARCAHWLSEHCQENIRPQIFTTWALGYAFITRDSVDPRADLSRFDGRIIEQYKGAPDICFFAALYHAGKLRANFWFEELHQFLDASLLMLAAGDHRDDPLVTALRAFAEFGRGNTDQGHDLLRTAWDTPDRSRAVVDVCLHALDVAAPFPAQGEELRTYATEAARTFPDHGVFYRLARGQRRCGQYTEAETSIRKALALLPAIGSRISHEHLQERYIREWDNIRSAEQDHLAVPEQPDGLVATETGSRRLPHTMIAAVVATVVLMVGVVAAATVTVHDDWSLADRLWAEAALFTSLLLLAVGVLAGLRWWTTTSTNTGRETSARTPRE